MTVTYDSVAKGTELPARSYQVTRLDLVKYAGASGDFNVIHWSDRAARAVGLPSVIAHGMYTMAQAGKFVTEWAGGDPGAVTDFGVNFSAMVPVPDDTSGNGAFRGHGAFREHRAFRGHGRRDDRDQRQGARQARRQQGDGRHRGEGRRREGAHPRPRHRPASVSGYSSLRGTMLAGYTTLGLGGPAREFVSAGTEQDLVAAVRAADEAGQPVLLIGGGSNLVISDAGFPGHRHPREHPRPERCRRRRHR